MKQRNLINLFYKTAVEEKFKIDSGISQLNSGFSLIEGFLNLLVCEPYSGGTALALEYAARLAETWDVVYFDPNQSVLINRVKGINMENLTVCYPNSGSEIIALVSELVKVSDLPRLYILDNTKNLRDGWDLKMDLGPFCANLRTIDPKCTVLAIQRASVARSKAWTNIGFISIAEKRYINSDLVGHVVSIKSNGKEGYCYVDYRDGRFSKGYNHALELVLAGKAKNGIFEYQDIREKGFWNFVEAFDGR